MLEVFRRRWTEKDVLLAGAVLTLVGFMGSVHLYKIFYISTACSLLAAATLVRPNVAEVLKAAQDGIGVMVYCAAMLASGITSAVPEISLHWLTIDAIFFGVFVQFYLVGLRCRPTAISQTAKYVVYASVLVVLATWDSGYTRQGFRVAFVIPYLLPLLFLSPKTDWAIAVGTAITAVTQTRTAIGIASILLVVSAIWFKRPRVLWWASGLVAAGALISPLRNALFHSFMRLATNPTDPIRDRIALLAHELIGSTHLFGIGYGNFGIYYVDRFPGIIEMVTLHSVYWAWFIEGGWIGSIAAACMLGGFFYQIWRARGSIADQPFFFALLLSMGGVLFAALFEQMHQIPTLFMLLGLGAGASRRALSEMKAAERDCDAEAGFRKSGLDANPIFTAPHLQS